MPGKLCQVRGNDLGKAQVGVNPQRGPVWFGQRRRDEDAAIVVEGNEESIEGGIKMGCK
jgi:hypothetical protein